MCAVEQREVARALPVVEFDFEINVVFVTYELSATRSVPTGSVTGVVNFAKGCEISVWSWVQTQQAFSVTLTLGKKSFALSSLVV